MHVFIQLAATNAHGGPPPVRRAASTVRGHFRVIQDHGSPISSPFNEMYMGETDFESESGKHVPDFVHES